MESYQPNFFTFTTNLDNIRAARPFALQLDVDTKRILELKFVNSTNSLKLGIQAYVDNPSPKNFSKMTGAVLTFKNFLERNLLNQSYIFADVYKSNTIPLLILLRNILSITVTSETTSWNTFQMSVITSSIAYILQLPEMIAALKSK